MILKKCRDILALVMLRFKFAMSFYGIISFGMQGLVLIGVFGLERTINVVLPIIVVLVSIAVIIGTVYDKAKIYNEEVRLVTERSPWWKELNARLDRIEKTLDSLKR